MTKELLYWFYDSQTQQYSQPFGPNKDYVLSYQNGNYSIEMRAKKNAAVEVDVFYSSELKPLHWILYSSHTFSFTETQFSHVLFKVGAKISLMVLIKDITLPPAPEPLRLMKCETTIIDDLRLLLAKEDTKDVVFTIDSQKLRAHKLILELRSPVFEKMFNVHMKEQLSHEVIIDDVSFDGFSAFLEFVYTSYDEISDHIEELLYLGDKYEVKELKIKAANSLMKKIDSGNALNTLVLFDRYRLPELKTEAIKFILKNKTRAYGAEKKAEFEKSNPHLAELIHVALEFNNFQKLQN